MDIKGVEIFSCGTWNEETYTVDHLNEMVRAFEENKVGARPHLKIGHDPKQKNAKEILGSGAPAAGWIENLYVFGEKLIADFSDVPEKLFDLIQKKAYRKVSSEIFHNIKIGGKTYNRMLAAVALLGAENPGVMNLSDIMSCYKLNFEANYDKLSINEMEFITNSKTKEKKKMEKTEQEVKLEFELSQKDASLKIVSQKMDEVEAASEAKDKEIEALKEFKIQAEKEKAELLAQAESARVEKFASDLVSEKLCTPAMKPLIAGLLDPDKKEYAMKVKDKDVMLSKEEMLKEALKLFKAASEVNFEESSSNGDDAAKDKDTILDAKAKEYAAKNQVSYGVALKAVMKETV